MLLKDSSKQNEPARETAAKKKKGAAESVML
eukprot:COSAG06_NODE_25304_length_640_cov_0.959335_1_plen_30_part_10